MMSHKHEKKKAPRTPRHTWTLDEDFALIRGVHTKGLGNWEKVINHIKNDWHQLQWISVQNPCIITT